MTPRTAGAVIVGVWAVARIFFWRTAPRRRSVRTDMPPLRRSLLLLVSASLVPTYVFYFTTLLDPLTMTAPSWLRWTGTDLVAVAVGLFIWSHAALGSNWTVDVALADSQSLTVSGPYSVVRHPMYSALILMGVALVPATANAVASVPYLIAILALYAERVKDEEDLMLQEFSTGYADYMARTGRIVPGARFLGRRR